MLKSKVLKTHRTRARSFLVPPASVFRAALTAFVLGTVWLSHSARGDERFAIQLLVGGSSLNVTGGANYSGSGGLGLELRPQINLEIDDINSAFGLFYEGHLGSNIGSYPVSRIGLAGNYYLLGLPLSVRYLENGVTFLKSHMAPFITGQLAFASVSIADTVTDPVKPTSFNGEALDYLLGGGIEIPMGTGTTLVMEVLLEGTLAGGQSTSSGTQSGNGLGISSFGGLLGLSFHP